jgi:hypothetical protein
MATTDMDSQYAHHHRSRTYVRYAPVSARSLARVLEPDPAGGRARNERAMVFGDRAALGTASTPRGDPPYALGCVAPVEAYWKRSQNDEEPPSRTALTH